MSYAPHRKRLLSRVEVASHILRNAGVAAIVLGGSLLLGMAGYRYLEGMSWIDALLNASMILSGEGPVAQMRDPAGKLFASFYALFSGVVFLSMVGFVFAPAVKHVLHRFHLEISDEGDAVPRADASERRGL